MPCPKHAIATICLVIIFMAIPSHAAPEKQDSVKGYRTMPWHLVDVWWDFGEKSTFKSMSIDVTISGKIAEKTNLYIAPFGLGHLNKTAFYGGIQTQTIAQTKDNPRRQNIGRGGIFSMWDERSYDAIRTAGKGYMQSAGYEGDFVSVRRTMNWAEGRYTCLLVKLDTQWIDDTAYTWVGYFIRDHQNDIETYCGALRFEGQTLTLSKRVAGFIELYGARPDSINAIPQIEVIFHNPVLNGQPVKNLSAVAIYPKDVPDYADARGVINPDTKSSDIHFKLGQPVERNTRRVDLFQAE